MTCFFYLALDYCINTIMTSIIKITHPAASTLQLCSLRNHTVTNKQWKKVEEPFKNQQQVKTERKGEKCSPTWTMGMEGAVGRSSGWGCGFGRAQGMVSIPGRATAGGGIGGQGKGCVCFWWRNILLCLQHILLTPMTSLLWSIIH